MRTKELRLALVCFGGVSLAVYMHGVTKEVWKLNRASMRAHAPDKARLPPAADSEAVYLALLEALPGLDLRVITDIVAGASAGGINGIMLARALVGGKDLDTILPLWLEGADSDALLDPAAASRPLSKLWAVPLVWWVRRRGLMVDDRAEMAAHQEVKVKLSRFMRSRWFAPPFSGARFSGLLLDALGAMERGTTTPPLLPRLHPFDLFVTVTDYRGAPERLRLNSPPEVAETEHRLVIGFRCPGGEERKLAEPAALAFAARATASFPGAFPPARIAEIDALLAARGEAWPGRNAFIQRIFPGRADPETIDLLDGAVLENRPFGPALAALATRPAHREVDRRFVYIDPRPGMHDPDRPAGSEPPGFFATILRSLADIPRQQPIKDSLAAIENLSSRIRRIRHIIEGLTPEVDSAIDGAIGLSVLLLSPTTQRLADWRSRLQAEAARRAGFAYGAYGRLKFGQVVEALAVQMTTVGGGPAEGVRAALWRLVREAGLDRPEAAQGKGGAASEYVLFLRRFDLDFRIRRLRFVIRRVNQLAEQLKDDDHRAAMGRVKAALYAILGPHLERRQAGWFDTAARAAFAAAATRPGEALDAMADALDLKALDTASDSAFVDLLDEALPRRLRRMLLATYLGFPFFDIAILPLLGDGGIDELDDIKVDRLSPADCTALTRAGGEVLKGALFNAFGAFFSRAYREHDYLWGRLHGAERLIDIVLSTLGEAPEPALRDTIRRSAFAAIIAAERPRLKRIPELFAALEAVLTRPDAAAAAPAGTDADNG